MVNINVGLIIFGVCFVILCFMIGWKLGDLESRVSYLESQLKNETIQDKDLYIVKDREDYKTYCEYLDKNRDSEADDLLSYEDWIKGYNCGGYHD